MRCLNCVIWSLAAALGGAIALVDAAEPTSGTTDYEHALAYFDEPEHPEGFDHFTWVNPDAPKGGTITLATNGTFDSFNPLVTKGTPAIGLALVGSGNWLYDRLLESSNDEVGVAYGLLAEGVNVSPDFRTVRFRLRAEARWHDGMPITAQDVVFTFYLIKEHGSPTLKTLYRHVTGAVAIGDHEVEFHINDKAPRNVSTALTLGELFPLPQHYWQDKDPTAAYAQPPLGSGPYRVSRFLSPRFVEYERVADYWASDLAVNRGRHNFDRIRYDYYMDSYALTEAQKSGAVDARRELSSTMWAQGFDIAAVHEKVLLKEEFPISEPIGLGGVPFVFNVRRPPLDDVRVREALALARDFEWSNRVMYSGVMRRSRSYFSGSRLQHCGLPSAGELALLEPLRDQVPERVFDTPYQPPTNSGRDYARQPLLRAYRLLEEAGWVIHDGVRVHVETGEPLEVTLLLVTPAHYRLAAAYIERLKRIGVQASARAAEPSQFNQLVNTFDFDIVVAGWPMRMIPGLELYSRFGSTHAHRPHGGNWSGIENPAVDSLIARTIGADSWAEFEAAGRALDRVLLWNFYAAPGLEATGYRMIWWDRFGLPEKVGQYGLGFPDTWWFDSERAARVEQWKKDATSRY